MISRKQRTVTDNEINSNVTKINANHLLSHFLLTDEGRTTGGIGCMKTFGNDNVLRGMSEGPLEGNSDIISDRSLCLSLNT